MYFRKKTSRGHTYLQIVEGYRDEGRVRQRVIATIGRLDDLQETGKLDGLLASGARFSEKLVVIGDHRNGLLETVRSQSVGPGLIFERLWKECEIGPVLRSAVADRKFGFPIERAVFLAVAHRLLDPGSDRASLKWKRDFVLPGTDSLELQHLYRTMAWLGEPLPKAEQKNRTPFAPRCTKDLLEEDLFERRKELFSGLVLAFFDTTSIYFEGRGGQTIGRRGKSKDHRPDLPQMVVGLVLDSEGRPLCCELWPGNTTDVKSLIPVIKRLRARFHVRSICVVTDRGMISKDTIKKLEDMKIDYILGARMRAQKEVKEDVLGRGGKYKEVVPERKGPKDPSPLEVKNVEVDGRRYVLCRNKEQARKDAADREAILAALRQQLRQGDKALVGNKGYRRYLRSPGDGFEIDEEKAKNEARFDGKWVLRTNLDAPADVVALTYKELWMVEALFRSSKSLLETRPIFHKRDETIRGHVFISFLALVMMRELQDRMASRGDSEAEWMDILRDLKALTESEVETKDGKRFILRSELKGWCGKTFQAVGVAIPPSLRTAMASTEEVEEHQ